MRNLKIICQEKVRKIDKQPSLSIKTLKNMTPVKDGKWKNFFKVEMLAKLILTSLKLKKKTPVAITVAEQRP